MALIYNSSSVAQNVHDVLHILGESNGTAQFINTETIVGSSDIVTEVKDSASGDESRKVVSPQALRDYVTSHQSQGSQGPQGTQGPRGYQGVAGSSGSDFWKEGEGVKTSASSSIHADYKVYAPSFYQNSDSSLKTKVSDIESVIDKILEIPTIKYYFNSDKTKELRIGTIAQDVEKVFPEIVNKSEKTGYLGVNYAELSVISIAALKDLIKLLKEKQII